MKYRILQNIETVLTKQEDDVLGSPSTQSRSWSWKFSSGESRPGSSTRLQDLSGVQVGPTSWVVSSSSDQQDLDHEFEVLILDTFKCTQYLPLSVTAQVLSLRKVSTKLPECESES